jgi:hypothetical protein
VAAADVAATGSGVNTEEVTRAATQEEVNAIQIHSSASRKGVIGPARWQPPEGEPLVRAAHGRYPSSESGERGRPRRRRTRGDDKWVCVHGEKSRKRDKEGINVVHSLSFYCATHIKLRYIQSTS